jgi:hypothetical protein
MRQTARMRADFVLVQLADLAVRRLRVLVVEVERVRDACEDGKQRAQQDQHRTEAKRHRVNPL